MRLVTYNIQYSRGKDGCCDLSRVAGEVSGADIIALQEVERFWPRSGMADQPGEIGRFLPDHYWVYGPGFDVHLPIEEAAEDGKRDNRRRQFGNMLLSRWPILSSRLFPLPKTYYGDRFNMHMGALEGVVEPPAGPLRLWSIHLGYLESAERLEQLRYLLEVQDRGPLEQGAWSGPELLRGDDWSAGAEPPAMPSATLWLGDFNMTPESEEYGLVTASDPFRVGLIDSWTLAGGDAEDGLTYFDYPAPGDGLRTDYCFLSADLTKRLARVWVDESALGSDHQPLWVELGD